MRPAPTFIKQMKSIADIDAVNVEAVSAAPLVPHAFREFPQADTVGLTENGPTAFGRKRRDRCRK